jgi:uncharacterized protein (DUF2252 family)
MARRAILKGAPVRGRASPEERRPTAALLRPVARGVPKAIACCSHLALQWRSADDPDALAISPALTEWLAQTPASEALRPHGYPESGCSRSPLRVTGAASGNAMGGANESGTSRARYGRSAATMPRRAIDRAIASPPTLVDNAPSMATRKQARAQRTAPPPSEESAGFRARSERLAAGKALRPRVPRESHADSTVLGKARDPVKILEASNRGRLQELVPIRYGRMARSPFTFLRGSAALMAHDLATMPSTGIRVQACGDCHLLNFGAFATPERNLVFDLNDFDETLPAPWEWDLKRLVVSFVIAGRDNRLPDDAGHRAVLECVRAYREHLRECSRLRPLEVWYQRLDAETLIKAAPDAKGRRFRQQIAKRARERVIENLFPRITTEVNGMHRIVDQPPILYHVADPGFADSVQEAAADYRSSLPDERRVLLDRYRLEDIALKVVGIGSVGTRCYIGLLFSEDGHPLILQFKEAVRAVLEPYAGKSAYSNQGQRVVVGQRLMQSSSDIFLGWVRGRRGHDFYVRQLRDMKMSMPIDGFDAVQLERYAQVCGWTLARAHAKSGDSATISGYLGKGDAFDRALGAFAVAYADQTQKDHAALVKAIQSGRIQALAEE